MCSPAGIHMPLLAELAGTHGVIVATTMAVLADLSPIAGVSLRKPASRQRVISRAMLKAQPTKVAKKARGVEQRRFRGV